MNVQLRKGAALLVERGNADQRLRNAVAMYKEYCIPMGSDTAAWHVAELFARETPIRKVVKEITPGFNTTSTKMANWAERTFCRRQIEERNDRISMLAYLLKHEKLVSESAL